VTGLVLLTGATGFVGRRLWPALRRAGKEVRGLTRDGTIARRRWPRRAWAEGSVSDAGAMARALEGCGAAFYLVHGMAEGGRDFRAREVAAAAAFARAAAAAGVGRLVYLGGVAPEGPPSEHLASRLEVGQVLRDGTVPTVELRASMIIGAGSLSWLIVRDLAARLPAMVLPRWLRSRTQPVAARDVVVALVRALSDDVPAGDHDLPGPDTLSGREILEGTARALGLERPLCLNVPLLSPWLSSQWIRFVTRADWTIAREVVVGLRHDVLARDGRYWDLIGHAARMPFAEAARRTVAEEDRRRPRGPWGAEERLVRRLRARAT
jgi:uncharacterized protein YbjT (DUF2867 family)